MTSQRPPSETAPAAGATAARPRWRFTLRWLLVAMAFLTVVVSHVNTSLKLRRAEGLVVHQREELARLRRELGIFEVRDVAQAHVLFVRQSEDKAWRWRVYLPPGRRYMLKWAVDGLPAEGLASQWEGQDFALHPKDSPFFNVDVFLRKAADGKWRWFVRYPWGELARELPDDHVLIAPQQPVVISGDPRSQSAELFVSDPRRPVVLFRYQVIPQAEFDAAQAQGDMPPGPHPGIMVWIEPAK